MNRDELRAAILGASDFKKVPVPTPEWPAVDGMVWVREMSAAAREEYLTSLRSVEVMPVAQGEAPKIRAELTLQMAGLKLAAATMCDENGELLFTQEDVVKLGEKSSLALLRIRDIAADLNNLGQKGGSAEEIKNGSPSQTSSGFSTV